jgi:hypothetical protein
MARWAGPFRCGGHHPRAARRGERGWGRSSKVGFEGRRRRFEIVEGGLRRPSGMVGDRGSGPSKADRGGGASRIWPFRGGIDGSKPWIWASKGGGRRFGTVELGWARREWVIAAIRSGRRGARAGGRDHARGAWVGCGRWRRAQPTRPGGRRSEAASTGWPRGRGPRPRPSSGRSAALVSGLIRRANGARARRHRARRGPSQRP